MMSLKEDIENIFKKKTGYAEPEHAIDQAESLKSLSVDLYTDSRRFVYELLQNADDSAVTGKTVKVGIRLFDDFLVVAHTGKPFDNRDLRGICGVSDGTKKNLIEKTGYKGIGFKAVFGQSEKVIIYTNKEFFRFDSGYNFKWNNKWGDNQQSWEEVNERKFSFPWQIIPIYTHSEEIDGKIKTFLDHEEWTVATIILLSKNKNEVKTAIEELSTNVNMFLFLKNIEELDFNLGTSNIVNLNRDNKNSTVEIKQNGKIKASWLLRVIKLEVPIAIKEKLKEEKNIPEKLFNAKETELIFAAKIDSDGIRKLGDNERLLYSYLPTEETKYSIPVLVNGSFVIGANRETLHEDSKWNQWLFENIPCEIVKWIAELVVGKYGHQAYELIPSKNIITNTLGVNYRIGLTSAFDTIPFIQTNQKELIKINQAVIDFTSFSKKEFIGESTVREYVVKRDNSETIHENPFLPFTDYGKTFKDIGVAHFEWRDAPKLLESDDFLKSHSSLSNIQVIQYFKQLCEAEKSIDISEAVIKKWPFILDHKGKLKFPNDIYFPTPDDVNWSDPNNEISFLNGDIQNFLLKNPEIRVWLENLGVIEKTDLSYLRKTIIENASTYSTHDNTIETILSIFNLYIKREIGKEELGELSELKLLTDKGSLLPAKYCYFSDLYSPRLKLQSILSDDFFVSPKYMNNVSEKDEFRRFFKMMGVKEGITILSSDKMSISRLVSEYQFRKDFFEEEDKYFKPAFTNFNADVYSNLKTLIFLSNSTEFNFSKLFWSDVIQNLDLVDIITPTIAYWGNSDKPGRTRGDEVENYLKWYIQNTNCIPTLKETTHKANEVFINSEDILQLAGNYLPVFNGIELSQDWKAFFRFKTNLQLSDYLELLTGIASDVNENGKVKRENINRIQSIYKVLLNQCANWSSYDISIVEEWANTESLLNTKDLFTECHTLKYFRDGNESIFQDQFSFIVVSSENKNHPNIEVLLTYFKVKILKQSDFKLDHSKINECPSLSMHLRNIIPYFKIWIENEVTDDNTKEALTKLQSRISKLKIYQADQLSIKYEDIDFTKNVNVHFNDSDLFVTNPWNKNSVLLTFPAVLCRYFYLLGHDKQLDFLLRSSVEEISVYFTQEKISIPAYIGEAEQKKLEEQSNNSLVDFDATIDGGSKLLEEFFHTSKTDYKSMLYAEKIVFRATFNILQYLKKIPEYDCSHASKIANSVIGGITKNGNEITIVARPSDGGEVLPFYSSEFDVLEYVDAEFWCEDGINTPKQITLGQLLKKTGINRIPIENIDISISDLESFITDKRSSKFDFNAVPFAPEKVARIISSFANTEGGKLIFGLKETSLDTNEIVGLSKDFNIIEITKKAVSSLLPIPDITYDWINYGDKVIFAIETKKSDVDVFFGDKKFIREGVNTRVENETLKKITTINSPEYSKTIAIIIGIEDYHTSNGISPVKYANNDVLVFKRMLIDTMSIAEEDITIFQNQNALKSSIEYDLQGLFHSLTECDRLVFYYVGHGFHNGVTNYLTTYDTHKHHIAETGISLRKILLDPLRKSKCRTALIFIDACAQTFEDPNERSQIANINDEEFIALNQDFPYYGTFLSCHPEQKSYSCDVLQNGIWTYHLVNALKGNVSEVIKGKYVTDVRLKEYLSKNVAEYTKAKLGRDQNPKAILDSGSENVILEIVDSAGASF